MAVVRPTEVLFEEWLALRKQGVQTPKIALWVCSPANSSTWRYVMKSIYNNPQYAELLYMRGNKAVFFLPYRPGVCYDAAEASLIQHNFGGNNITTVNMWALFGPSTYAQGVWGFFSPCVSKETGAYTTSIIGEGACNQYSTTDQGTGDMVEVSASGGYMLSQCALPFASPGKLRGLTMQRLFAKVLADRPPNLFLSSFNEHIGGRQAPASQAEIAFNMGLPNDPQRMNVWVDTYGSEFSRDVEPTIEGGSRIYDVLRSCIELYKKGTTCDDNATALCCTTADKELWINVWELHSSDDSLLTADPDERDVLLKEGWHQTCSPIPGPSVFCVDSSNKDGRNGPFLLYHTKQPNTKAIYRCYDSHLTRHSVSDDKNCDGLGQMESILGYAALGPGGEMLRALRRCRSSSSKMLFHALDLPCNINDSHVLGYVR